MIDEIKIKANQVMSGIKDCISINGTYQLFNFVSNECSYVLSLSKNQILKY